MPSEYGDHLAAAVLSDGKVVSLAPALCESSVLMTHSQKVSYRMLSRELKVHNNVAKRYMPSIENLTLL